jgi:hypothetical protein
MADIDPDEEWDDSEFDIVTEFPDVSHIKPLPDTAGPDQDN